MKTIIHATVTLLATIVFLLLITPQPAEAQQIYEDKSISAGRYHTVGLESDGTVVACGYDGYGQVSGVSGWTGIEQVSAAESHTVGLKNNGTVVACGYDSYGQVSGVDGWTNIMQVSAAEYHTVGLKSDGTVVACGHDQYGQVSGVNDWANIVQVSAAENHTVGLKSDRTVVAYGYNGHGQVGVSGWAGIKQVSAAEYHTVGLKSDGTVVACGNDQYNKVSGANGWTEIVQVSAGVGHTVGLKSDGTVVACGNDNGGQVSGVNAWANIVQVSTAYDHTVGLRIDGTIVACGSDIYGRVSGVNSWNDIMMPPVTIYVNSAAGPGGNGTSWAQAFNNLQSALDNVTNVGTPCQIWVAAGTYTPVHPGSAEARTDSFRMKNRVSIYGGFPGTDSPTWTDRDWQSNKTTLSGDIGIPGDASDNCYHVFYHPDGTNLNASTRLDGVTISGGNADGAFPHNSGGGMYNHYSSPRITNCTFGGNSSVDYGGGMHNHFSSPIVTNCSYIENTASLYGGAMANINQSSPVILNCNFSGNEAEQIMGGSGGAIFNNGLGEECKPVLANCSFTDNVAAQGGGIYNCNNASAAITNCTFSGNTAYDGAGICNSEGVAELSQCTLWGNTATSNGGGVYAFGSSGSEVYSFGTAITNCTFYGNSAANGNGIACDSLDQLFPGTISITNCILRDGGDEIANDDGSTLSVNYSNIQGGHPGAGNINQDPLLADPVSGDFHLLPPSPCVDTGSNSAVQATAITEDFEGDKRIINGTVDMGVDESWQTVYVRAPEGGPYGTDDGSTWANAFNNLQQALSAAGSPCEIWVAAGVYNPVRAGSPGQRTDSFQMKNGVGFYGGFTGSETARNQRDWETNETILSGDIGIQGYQLDDCFHVFYHPEGTDLNETAILDGFTVTKGYAIGDYPHDRGGGMHSHSSSPTLRNCAFSGNSAKDNGGGIINYSSSSPTLISCTFSGNTANGDGGGIYNGFSSPILTDCTFSGNTANDDGGGIYNGSSSSPVLKNCTFSGNTANNGGGISNRYSSPNLVDCTFSGNIADTYGGCMYNYQSSPDLRNCAFSGNSADYGGGIFNSSSSPTLTDCTFSDNSTNSYDGGAMNNYQSSPILTNCGFESNSARSGGGLYNKEFSFPVLENCTLLANTANQDGGGIYNELNSSPTIINSIVSSNTAGRYGGGMYNYSGCLPAVTNCTFWNNPGSPGGSMYNSFYSSPMVTNSIFWGSPAEEIYNTGTSAPVVTYCDVQGGYPGAGNIDQLPKLVNPGSGDFHLLPTSPCIDTGINTALNLPSLDYLGDPRIHNGTVDMGVDEFTGVIQQYTLQINSTAGGLVTTPGEGLFGPYNEGSIKELVAQAGPGSLFAGWTGDTGTIVDVNDPTTTIAINGDYAIVANFEGRPPVGLGTRLLPNSVVPGSQCEVSISVAGCGDFGQVVENLPEGFTYFGTDFDGIVAQNGREITFTFIGDGSDFTYTVTAPLAQGMYEFYGVSTGDDLVDYSIGGDEAIEVYVWSPWNYDLNHDGTIIKQEALAAVVDFFGELITKQQALQVIVLFFA